MNAKQAMNKVTEIRIHNLAVKVSKPRRALQ